MDEKARKEINRARRPRSKQESEGWFKSKLTSSAPNVFYDDMERFQKLKIKMGYKADLPPNSPSSD